MEEEKISGERNRRNFKRGNAESQKQNCIITTISTDKRKSIGKVRNIRIY